MDIQTEERWTTRFWRWLKKTPSERRRDTRYALPGLIGFHWNGGLPIAHLIGNISRNGIFLLTEDRLIPGTRILMTLQRAGSTGDDPEDVLAVQTRVVRWGPDGLGFELLPQKSSRSRKQAANSLQPADGKALKAFLKSLNLNQLQRQPS